MTETIYYVGNDGFVHRMWWYPTNAPVEELAELFPNTIYFTE